MKTLLGFALAATVATATAQPVTPPVAGPIVDVRSASTLPVTIGSSDNFTGTVRVSAPFQASPPGTAGGATVSFEAGAHTAWHTHPRGQTLIVTAGTGLVQQAGQPARVLRPGDIVTIPANTRHWHGATPGSTMAHIAIAEREDGRSVTWQDKLRADEYQSAAAAAGVAVAPASAGPSRAQQLMGDVAPKLADLTDQVLFGDIWERPGLSKRDRSLATVSALIAMDRPDQLRSHLTLGLQNGLVRTEISELITHLAFYAGWPSAVTAATTAKEVFATR